MALIDNINLYKKLVIEVDEPITDIITCVQEDADSRYLDVQLFKSGVSFDLSGTKVRIYMVKPDGTNIMNDGKITDAVSGRCQFLLTTQALAACGILKTQIKVFSETEEQILSTQIFKIDVTESLLTNKTIESTNEYGSLVILFQDIYEALQVMTAIKNNFGEPGETAQLIPVETFWQMLEAVYNVNAEALKNVSMSEVVKKLGKIETYSGRIRDVQGRIFAAVMEGSETPLKAETQTSESYSPISYNMLQDNEFIYFFEASRIVKINKQNMQQSAVNSSFAKTIVSACIDDEFIYANVEDKSNYGTIYKFSKNDLSKVAQTGSTYNYDGAVYCDNQYLYAVRGGGDYITKMNKSNLSDIESSSNQSISSMTTFAVGSEYVYMTNRGGVYKHLKTNISTKSEFCKVSNILGLLIDDNNLYVVHGDSGSTSVNITAYSLSDGSSVASGTVNIGRKNEKGIMYTSIDDTYIYLYDEVTSRKIFKIMKSNLKVSNSTEQTYAEPFCVDGTNIYASSGSNSKISKIRKTSDSIYNVSGFNEV